MYLRVTVAQALLASRRSHPPPPAHCFLLTGLTTRPGLVSVPLPLGLCDSGPPGSSPGSAACEGPAQRLGPEPLSPGSTSTHTLPLAFPCFEAGHALSDPRGVAYTDGVLGTTLVSLLVRCLVLGPGWPQGEGGHPGPSLAQRGQTALHSLTALGG